MVKRSLLILVCLAILSGCGSTKVLPTNLTDGIHDGCTTYQTKRPIAVAIRAEIAKKIDEFPEETQKQLRTFDRETLPKIDAAGAALCAADALLTAGQAPDWLRAIPWEEVIPVVFKLATGI